MCGMVSGLPDARAIRALPAIRSSAHHRLSDCAEQRPGRASTDMSDPATKQAPRATILVVDATPADLATMVGRLEHSGYRVVTAADHEAALQRAGEVRPDLILLDAMLPSVGGIDTCRRLKADKATCDIPVIFMSAPGDVAHRVQGYAAGGVDYV